MRITALLAVVGAALGAAVATTLHFVTRGYYSGGFGFYGYARRYADYLPTGAGVGPHPAWTPAVPLWTAGGLVLGVFVAATLALPGDLAVDARARLLAAPALLGAVVGLSVGALVGLDDRQTIYHGSYRPLNSPGSYSSVLRITFSGSHTQRLLVLPIGGGLGLLAGIAVGGAAVVARTRSSAAGPV